MSFSTTAANGKKSVHTVEPFMTAGPEYRRNWLGTVASVILGMHFLPFAVFRIHLLVTRVEHGDWKNWYFYLNLVIGTVVLILNLAVLVIYFKALRNPRYLHGVDSVDNLKPYKYYIFVLVAIFSLNLLIAIVRKVQKTGESNAFTIPIIDILYLWPDVLVYWAWGYKCDAHAVPARVFMPFLPKT